MANEILKESKVTRCVNATAAGTSDINGSSVDMAGYDKVTFICCWGTITDGTPALKVQQSSDDGSSDTFDDLAGTSVSVATTDDNKICAVEVVRPVKRYLRPVVVRGGATGASVDAVIAVQSGASRIPTTHDATVAANEVHLSPGEGTA